MFRSAIVIATLFVSTSAQAGLFQDHWVPKTRTCAADGQAVRQAVKAAVTTCRAAATETDALGTPHVSSPDYLTCMTDAGWTKTRRAEKKTWLAACHTSEAASSLVASK